MFVLRTEGSDATAQEVNLTPEQFAKMKKIQAAYDKLQARLQTLYDALL